MLKGPTALPDLKEFITFLNFNRCDWKNRKIIRTSLSQEVQWWLSGSWNLFIDLFSSIDKDIIKPVSHSFWVLYFNIIMYEVRYTRTNLIFQFNNWLNTCPKLFHIRLVSIICSSDTTLFLNFLYRYSMSLLKVQLNFLKCTSHFTIIYSLDIHALAFTANFLRLTLITGTWDVAHEVIFPWKLQNFSLMSKGLALTWSSHDILEKSSRRLSLSKLEKS